jgi:opacity protein-like surface antigen
MLPYILVGISLAKFDITHEISDPFGGSASWSDSRVHAGPVLGFGFQYALQNDLALGVEYLYTPYGMQRYASDVTGPFAPAPGFPGAFTQNLTTQAVRLVLNYKFDGMISGGR